MCDDHVELVHGKECPFELVDRDVLIADFSYKRTTLKGMHADARSLQVLDHHATARDELAGLFCQFADDKCGTRMTWEFFHGIAKPPYWLQFIEDRDLWKHEFEETPSIRAWLESFLLTLQGWREALNARYSATDSGVVFF